MVSRGERAQRLEWGVRYEGRRPAQSTQRSRPEVGTPSVDAVPGYDAVVVLKQTLNSLAQLPPVRHSRAAPTTVGALQDDDAAAEEHRVPHPGEPPDLGPTDLEIFLCYTSLVNCVV